jgi:hypothetical protein
MYHSHIPNLFNKNRPRILDVENDPPKSGVVPIANGNLNKARILCSSRDERRYQQSEMPNPDHHPRKCTTHHSNDANNLSISNWSIAIMGN